MVRLAWSERYCHPLPEGHRFPMEKYNLIPEQLLYEGSISPSALFAPDFPDWAGLTEVHDPQYLAGIRQASLPPEMMRRIGFPQSPGLMDRERQIAMGTLRCAEYALENGLAINVAGGTHHAFRASGEGFCILNDIAVAAGIMLRRQTIRSVLVVDLDVHQGNGTAAIFDGDPRVFTFSMHGQNNFPLRKEKSDLDIGLPDGTGGSTYLPLLETHLNRIVQSRKPGLVFYQAGADVLATDRLGRLALTPQECAERDYLVFSVLKREEIPVVTVMGGGYSPRIRDVVDAHCQTIRTGLAEYG